jgi:hypothetical protein
MRCLTLAVFEHHKTHTTKPNDFSAKPLSHRCYLVDWLKVTTLREHVSPAFLLLIVTS